MRHQHDAPVRSAYCACSQPLSHVECLSHGFAASQYTPAHYIPMAALLHPLLRARFPLWSRTSDHPSAESGEPASVACALPTLKGGDSGGVSVTEKGSPSTGGLGTSCGAAKMASYGTQTRLAAFGHWLSLTY